VDPPRQEFLRRQGNAGFQPVALGDEGYILGWQMATYSGSSAVDIILPKPVAVSS